MCWPASSVTIHHFHNINLSMCWPASSVTIPQHPDSWPGAFVLSTVWPCRDGGAYFQISPVLDTRVHCCCPQLVRLESGRRDPAIRVTLCLDSDLSVTCLGG